MLQNAPLYRQYFKKIWVLENKNSTSIRKTGPMVSDGRLELIFVSGNGYKAIFKDHIIHCTEGIYLGGHLDQTLELEVLPFTKIWFLKLEPWTAGLISQFNYQKSLNQTIPLKELNKALYEKLTNFNFAENTGKVLQSFGREIDQTLIHRPDFKLIRYGSQLLENQFMDFKTAKQTLLKASNLSARSVELKFARYVGLTPKKFANTVQFRKISEVIYHQQSPASLTALVYDYGYYDQAHFIRTCQRLLGFSPKLLSPETCFITHPNEAFRYYTI